jgi:HSP20 family protein
MDKQDLQKTAPPSPAPELWRSFRDEFDRLFDRFTAAPWSFPMLRRHPAAAVSNWFNAPMPVVDVAEDDNKYLITAELPGLTEKDVDVSIDGANLVIRGEKHDETKTGGKNYHLVERAYGAFERSFFLPDNVDRTQIKAEVAKGVLTVTLPKTAAAQETAKKIEVKSA